MISTFSQAQDSLAPYIRSRKEAIHTRQVLAAHLDSQLNSDGRHSQGAILSLAHGTTSVKSISKTVPKLRKEYLKALRANILARSEYEHVCDSYTVRSGNSATREVAPGSSNPSTTSKGGQLDGYLDLIKQRQRHERLRILQDYLYKLEQKAAATTSYLDRANPRLSGLSQIPVEIATSSSSVAQATDNNALTDLIRGLEQAVLRAKVQLKNKKEMLELVKNSGREEAQESFGSRSRDVQILEALGRTRDELIRWMEEELGKAGDAEPKVAPNVQHQFSIDDDKSVEDQLVLVNAQYSQYIQARKTFINTIAETIEPVPGSSGIEKKEGDLETNEMEMNPPITCVILPYLRDLQLISNEQKSIIQQKSHLTVSLAKQHKEAVQLFDRLAHESHLLPAYPLKLSRKDHLDLDEMGGKETPSASHRARAWTYAAESASSATNESVIASLEEGESAFERAREMLFSLKGLLGRTSGSVEAVLEENDIWISESAASRINNNKSNPKLESTVSTRGDIWATLNGNLGVL